MKTYIFLLTAFVVSCSANSECRKFHTGKFVLLSTAEDKTIILRTDSTQIEYSEKTNAGTILKVRWIDDCTYELYDPIDKKTGKILPTNIRVRGEIYEVSENGYFVKMTSNISTKEVKFEVKKIDPE